MTQDNRIAEELIEAMKEAALDGISDVVDYIVVEGKKDTPPTDLSEGTRGGTRNPDPERPSLRDSWHVTWFPDHVVIAVIAPHAVKQHEALHFKHPRGGRAKFLERHVAAANNLMIGKISASVQSHLTGTGRIRVRSGTRGLRF